MASRIGGCVYQSDGQTPVPKETVRKMAATDPAQNAPLPDGLGWARLVLHIPKVDDRAKSVPSDMRGSFFVNGELYSVLPSEEFKLHKLHHDTDSAAKTLFETNQR